MNTRSGQTFNGDIAFNASGDLFIVRGFGSTNAGRVDLYTVSRAALEGASGGNIGRSAITDFDTGSMTNVNGIAFDAAGKADLGNGTTMYSYDMPAWNNPHRVTSSLGNSTDLATCSSPSTITLQKNIVDGRAKAGDQFKLTLGSTGFSATAETSGAESGVQGGDAMISTPTRPGTSYTFSEEFIKGALGADYATSWACTVEDSILSSGTGISGSVDVPASGGDVVCEISNAPLAASIILHKEVESLTGTIPGEGWELGVEVTGDATLNGTLLANSSGTAAWKIPFQNLTDSADVMVFEVPQAGYEFKSGVCEVTSPGQGQPSEVLFEDDPEATLTGVSPGDRVECVFTNTEIPTSATIAKQWRINGGDPIPHGEQPDGFDAELMIDAQDANWGAEFGPVSAGTSLTVSETTEVDSELYPLCEIVSRELSGPGITGSTPVADGVAVTLGLGEHAFTITNSVECDQKLTLVKEVDNTFGENGAYGPDDLNPDDWSLGASAWTLTATGEDTYTFTGGSPTAQSVPTGTYAHRK